MMMRDAEIKSAVEQANLLKHNPQIFDVYRFISNLYRLFDGTLPESIEGHIQKLIGLTGSDHLRHAFEHGYFERNYRIENGTYCRGKSTSDKVDTTANRETLTEHYGSGDSERIFSG